MKKLNIIAVILSVLALATGVFMLAGCQSPIELENQGIKPPPPGMAKALVQLPGASNARAVGYLDSERNTNFYEVALRDSTTGAVIFKNAGTSENAPFKGYIEVELQPGTYDILLFAGDNRYTPDSPLLLGTAYKKDVQFVKGEIKNVYMTLDTFDLDPTVSSSKVEVNEEFTAGFTVRPKNPLIAGGAFPHRNSTVSVDGDTESLAENGWEYDAKTGTYTYTRPVSVRNPTGDAKAVIGFTGNIVMFGGMTESATPVWTYADFGHLKLGGYYKKEVSVDRPPAIGNIYIDWELGIDMIRIDGGFYMGKYEVTQGQYERVTGSNPSYHTTFSGGDNPVYQPAEQVSWYDALVFCNKLSMLKGLNPAYSINGSTNPSAWGTVPTNNNATWNAVQIVAGSTGYRLPTGAQWEYACRAGTTTAYNTGDTISDDTGWYVGNSGGRTHEVGFKTPNEWGLYDMHGNVAEWCWDQSVSGSDRVVRGGSWNDNAQGLSSASQGSQAPYSRNRYTGFRIALSGPDVSEPEVWTVTFNANGANGTAPGPMTVNAGSAITLPSTDGHLTRDYYAFDGWNTNAQGTGTNYSADSFFTPTSNITLYAKWIYGQVWVSKDGGPNNPFDNLEDAMDTITTAGDYMVKIGVNQDLEPYTFRGTEIRNITLTAMKTPVSVQLSSSGNLFTVSSRITLTLDNGITLRGRSENTNSVIQVNTGGELIMKTGSVITGNTVTGNTVPGYGNGGGVYVSSGTFTMYGGEISGNTVSGDHNTSGGGVYISSYGTFTMNGGEISGNSINNTAYVALFGGGVDAHIGTFTMNGGKISGNTINGYGSGGGVHVGVTFTMNGGEISGNTINGYGYGYGGGVDVGGTFTMNGGKISNNSSSSGGGVSAILATFTMHGGEISGNTAEQTGGGVGVFGERSTFTMHGGEISNNSSSSGGGVGVSNRTFTMYGGEIYGNTSSSGGGGVYVDQQGTFHIIAGTIYGSNEANTSLRNTASQGAALALYPYYATAQYGTFSGEEWNSNGNLITTNNTIKVLNGVLQ